MATPEQLKEDLHYVVGAIERDRQGMPRSIGLLWAGYTLGGFAGLDWDPRAAGLFLLVGGPLLYLVSMKLGMRSALASGVRDREAGRRHMLHWGSIFLGMCAIALIARANGLSGEVFGQLITLIVGLVYFLAGVHFRISVFLWLGPLAMAGAAAVSYVDRWGWTLLGVLIAAGIMAATIHRPPVQERTEG
jgi:hypothetical protein